VCDASKLYMQVIDELLKLAANHALWTLPCVWIVTLKLPFPRVRSIETHVNLIHERIPDDLEQMAAVMYPNNDQGQSVSYTYRVEHLMANSVCERTLIAVFKKKE
jgi:hypothetical protein